MATSSLSSFTVVSTFSGCGGSSLGYQLAGGKVRLAVEWDDNAVATYRLNFPDTPIYHGDICKLSVDKCCELAGIEPGELDILDGSPPCQGFSTTGKRNFDDDRNQLFLQFARLLGGLQPRVFVMENVSGMVKGKMRLIFVECLRALKANGYKVKARVLNAMYFNVPQSRQRLIFIGVRDDLGIEPNHPKGQTKPQAVSEAIRDIDDIGWPLTPEASKYWGRMKPGESASKYHPKGHLFGLIKVHPRKPSPALTRSAGASKLTHWNEQRFLGNLERIRLASFPDCFRWAGSRTDIYNCVGNSVPPNFMRAIAEHIYRTVLQAEAVPA